MCGHFGAAGHLNKNDIAILRQLGFVSQLRGTDGTGVFQINTRARVPTMTRELLVKNKEDFSYFLLEQQYDKENGHPLLLNDDWCDLVIGHVRSATAGSINNQNAHPFGLEKIVGAHNGTLRDFKYQDKEKTDSELMFRDIQERGMKAVLEDLRPDSAFAIVLYDRENKTITFARNKHRTLYFTFNKKRSVMYWASEALMLELILSRNGVEYEEPKNFKEGILATINTDCIKIGQTNIFKVEDINLKKEVVTARTGSNFQDWDSIWHDWTPPKPQDQLKTNTKINKETKESEKKGRITAEECLYCTREMNLVDQHYGRFDKHTDSFVCEECDDDLEDDDRNVYALDVRRDAKGNIVSALEDFNTTPNVKVH